MTPMLFVFALRGEGLAFLLWAYLIVLTDVLDGPLARAWNITSLRGQWLDGSADTFFYASVYGLAIYLMAEEAVSYWTFLLPPALLIALLPPAAILFTGRVRCMHLWSKRAISYLFLPWLTVSILDRFNVTLLIAVNVLTLVAFVEEMVIYVVARDSVDETITSIRQLQRSQVRTA